MDIEKNAQNAANEKSQVLIFMIVLQFLKMGIILNVRSVVLLVKKIKDKGGSKYG